MDDEEFTDDARPSFYQRELQKAKQAEAATPKKAAAPSGSFSANPSAVPGNLAVWDDDEDEQEKEVSLDDVRSLPQRELPLRLETELAKFLLKLPTAIVSNLLPMNYQTIAELLRADIGQLSGPTGILTPGQAGILQKAIVQYQQPL